MKKKVSKAIAAASGRSCVNLLLSYRLASASSNHPIKKPTRSFISHLGWMRKQPTSFIARLIAAIPFLFFNIVNYLSDFTESRLNAHDNRNSWCLVGVIGVVDWRERTKKGKKRMVSLKGWKSKEDENEKEEKERKRKKKKKKKKKGLVTWRQ